MSLALIVDDSPFLGLHLSGLLDSRGIATRIPADASELRDLAPAADVIFVELLQFEANGFQVTRELAAQVACSLVLLTGTGRDTDLQWALRAGACAVLQRPLTAARLERLLQLLKLAPPESASGASQPGMSAPSRLPSARFMPPGPGSAAG
ncbi:MAG: hypothetical protein RLZZ227_1421 [Pseudomonadota bacterium]